MHCQTLEKNHSFKNFQLSKTSKLWLEKESKITKYIHKCALDNKWNSTKEYIQLKNNSIKLPAISYVQSINSAKIWLLMKAIAKLNIKAIDIGHRSQHVVVNVCVFYSILTAILSQEYQKILIYLIVKILFLSVVNYTDYR